MSKSLIQSPIAIGGIGGSGTRIVAELAKQMGVYIGDNVNESNDNLSYPNLRELVHLSSASTLDKNAIANKVIEAFKQELVGQFLKQNGKYNCWGWKAPGTYFWLEYFKRHIPELSYVHVIRNGLDMAMSTNQNQLHAWGTFFGIDAQKTGKYKAALEFWISANQYAIKSANEVFGDRFYLVNYDRLCEFSVEETKGFAKFIGFELSDLRCHELASLVITPTTMGRFKTKPIEKLFDLNSIQIVEEMGFSVDPE